MVQEWSLATGQAADVVINVHNSSFFLHKDALTIKSGYFRHHLKDISQLSLSPPLNITAETFNILAEFCYGAPLVLTPFNIAPLRVASTLLQMSDDDEVDLSEITEDYFRDAISMNREYAVVVFRSSLSLLPEAEAMARLVSRCIVALSLMGDDNGVIKCLEEVKEFCLEDFELIVESLDQRLTHSHDVLYKVIDFYLKKFNNKLSEEKRRQICNHIDCSILSPHLLMEAVQNPRMPLRFIVQAMFVEQVNTRRSIISAADSNTNLTKHQPPISNPATLGAILQRDAALREVSQLKATMNVTSSRIENLENQLISMREIVQDSNSGRSNSCRFVVENKIERGQVGSVSSGSFRFGIENKIERGQVGSVSSGSFRFLTRKDRGREIMCQNEESCYGEGSYRMEKGYGRRLFKGVKSAFKLPNFLSSKKKMGEGQEDIYLKKYEMEKVEDRNNVVVIKKDVPFQKNSR